MYNRIIPGLRVMVFYLIHFVLWLSILLVFELMTMKYEERLNLIFQYFSVSSRPTGGQSLTL